MSKQRHRSLRAPEVPGLTPELARKLAEDARSGLLAELKITLGSVLYRYGDHAYCSSKNFEARHEAARLLTEAATLLEQGSLNTFYFNLTDPVSYAFHYSLSRVAVEFPKEVVM